MGRKATGDLNKARLNSIRTYASVIRNPDKYSAKRVAHAQAQLKAMGVTVITTPKVKATLTLQEMKKAYANYTDIKNVKYGRKQNNNSALNYTRKLGSIQGWELASGDVLPQGTALNKVKSLSVSEVKILKKYANINLGGKFEVDEIIRYLRQVKNEGLIKGNEYNEMRATLLKENFKNTARSRQAIHDYATNDEWRLTRVIDLNGVSHNQKYLDDYYKALGGESHIYKGFVKWASFYGITRVSTFTELDKIYMKFDKVKTTK